MLTFPRVPLVEAGQPLRSRDVAALARALKARDLSGVGNTVWRRLMWAYNAFRQVRNPDETGFLFPPQGEFFEIYQHFDPETNPPKWPNTGPGDPEGLNLASTMNGFVFGGPNLDSEQFRMGDGLVPLWYHINGPATNPEEWWELAKAQRGVIDPDAGVQNVPALEAAQSAQLITSGGIVNPHGKAWGGLFPAPVELGVCGADPSGGSTIPNFQIFFTALTTTAQTGGLHGTISTNGGGFSVVTYAGSCPLETDNITDGHVLTIWRFTKFYAVAVYQSGGIVWDILPTADWIEGPYTGNGVLMRQDGGHISRALWAFIKDFRGTRAQRTPDTFDIEELAFSFQEFLSSQYHLAPNLGFYNGAEISSAYPNADATVAAAGETIPAGTFLKFGSAQAEAHEYRDGFVLSGFVAKSVNLFAPVTLEILNGSKLISRVTLQPGGEAVVKYLDDAIAPAPLRVRLASKAKFTDAGGIYFEANELVAYKPDHWDAYMLLRLAATKGGFEDQGSYVDGSGVDETQAKTIFDAYAQYGCVVNTVAAGVRTIENFVSENPVYDAMRRLTRDFMRIVNRRQLLTYEVAGGKAILRFKRWPYGYNNTHADYFAGIAPDWRGVSETVEGVEYIVRSHTGGSITYGGREFSHEQRFTADKTKTFETKGDALLLEYEGIKRTAPRKGWTNEWCLFLNFHPYHPSESSIWKTDAYGDYFTWNNRALMYSPDAPTSLRRMATVYQSGYDSDWISPEAPDAFNYFGNSNSGADADFCSSNPIFKAPYEIDSVTLEFDPDGNDVVKIICARLQTHPDAPATVSADPTTWSAGELADLAAEGYRTDDNGLRQYQALQYLNLNSAWKNGDDAFNSFLQLTPDNPFACCIPHIFLAKLPEEPFADGNDVLDEHDTRVTIENFLRWEIWLRAGCEGFVDGTSTQQVMCAGGGLPYDYIFENLTFHANHKRFIGDFSSGHGPMVNTTPLASLFNEYARCVNLLNKVQVHRLLTMQTNTRQYETIIDTQQDWGNGPFCPPTVNAHFWKSGCPPEPALQSESGWVDGGFLGASVFGDLTQCGPGGTGIGFKSTKTDVQYRYVPVAGFENALPQSIKDLAQGGSVSIWGTLETFSSNYSVSQTTDGSLGEGCITSNGAFEDYFFTPSDLESSSECIELSSGIITVGNAPCGVFALCSQADGSPDGFGELPKASSNTIKTFAKLNDDNAVVVVVPLVDQEVSS